MSEKVPLGPALLAGLNVAMVTGWLAITAWGVVLQGEAADERAVADRRWEEQADLHGRLLLLGRPGNEVLVDRDVEAHRSRFAADRARFDASFAAMVAARGDDAAARSELAEIERLVERMALETQSVFAAVERGDVEGATAPMARLDAETAAAQRAFETLHRIDSLRSSAAEDGMVSRSRSAAWLGGALGLVVSLTTAVTLLHLARQHGRVQRTAGEQERLLRELRQARSDAEAASRTKSEFLANMSHEIRTPMTAILGYADLLLDVHQAPSDRLDCIQTIRRNGGHLLQLVNDILDLSKIEAGRLDVEEIQCDPGVIVAEVGSLMQVRASERGVAFEVAYDGPVPQRVITDPTRLRQILLNLVGNALKFTERGSVRLIVRCHAERQRLEFDVIDTGVGMSEETIGRLFRPFTQADSSTTRQFGGTGLGLTISRRLAGMLGGDLSVRSAVGVGSTFTGWVRTGPLEGIPTTTTPMQRAAPNHRQAVPRVSGRILLAEDGPDNQRLIQAILRLSGAEVEVVDNGRSAVERALAEQAAGRPFGLVLMDMQMPVLDGYGATSLLRSRGYRLPIVALTAHAMQGDREKCLLAGCDDHETKPVDRASLLQTVARYLADAADADLAAAPSETVVPLHSTYASDPEIAPLIRDFCVELPARVEDLGAAWTLGDRDKVRRISHQLRGAGGAYGYAVVTDLCRTLEEASRHPSDDLTQHIEALRAVARRIAVAQAA
jgi:signal transduction histidine kinase/CheY-like chemotaxis protein